MKTLPILDNLRIASPCTADWDEMRGDERVRFCGRCEKNVYNLSSMTRGEAEALVREKEGRLCVRLYKRADGTVLTADCPVGVRRERLRQRMWASVLSAAASVMLALGLFTGRARADLAVKDGKKQPVVKVEMMGGAVAIEPRNVEMGKIAPPKPQPKKKKEKPEMLMGDVAYPE